MTQLNIGDNAIDFDLPSTETKNVKLSDYRGKYVVLYFYPKDDTSGCTTEAIEFNILKDSFTKLGVEIIGMSPDSVKKHEKFKAKHDFDLTLVSDEDKQVLEAYGVWVEKSMYGRKYMGVERTTFLIDPQGKIIEIWRKVSVSGHAHKVLERCQQAV